MPIDRRATWLFVSLLMLSCRRGSGSPEGEGIQVLDVDAPLGQGGSAISQCNGQGQNCTPVARGDVVAAGALVTSARGARVSLASDRATSVDLAEESAVLFNTGSHIEMRRGGVLVRRLGTAGPKAEPLRIDVAGQTGEIDAQVGGTVVVRARGSDRAGVTVEKGKLVLHADKGHTMVLLSGESAELVRGRPPLRVASFVTVEPRRGPAVERPTIAEVEPRGLGRMTARVPGQNDVVAGVRLVSHHVEAVVRDGFARTEVEEVFHNDTSQVLEGRYVFPLPADASISRLALWVNDKLVEGEIVEKKRAAAIFKGIVDDTVRPRDPALLEWVSGGEFSLKIFPLPARGSRKVRIAYDQVIPESAGRIRYAYPLSVGAERATMVDDFSMQVRVTDTRSLLDEIETPRYATSKSGDPQGFQVRFSARQFVPSSDFVVSYARQAQDEADVAAYVPSWGELKGAGLDGAERGADGTGYFALRVRADLPLGMTPTHVRRDRAIVVDTSHSQSKETLEGEAKLAFGLVSQLDVDERFVVLACDSACAAYPKTGLAAPTGEHLAELEQWLSTRVPSGSSDIAGSLLSAARRLEADGSGQVIYVGDGSPTSGELSATSIAARVRAVLRDRKVDLRFLGAGRAIDEVVVGALATELGATYEPVTTGDSIERRIADLAIALRSPVIRGATVELPGSFIDMYPKTLRNLRLGEQVVVVGRLLANEPGLVRLRGEVDGQTYTLVRPVRWTPEATRQNPLVPRLWSLARISELESSTDAATVKQIVDLSKRYHVMSRYTSLLVLENDQMFAEYGIPRTAPVTAGLPVDPALDPPVRAANQGQAAQREDDGKDSLSEKKKASLSDDAERAASPAKPSVAAPRGRNADGDDAFASGVYGGPWNAPAPAATMAPLPSSPRAARPASKAAAESRSDSAEGEVARQAGTAPAEPSADGSSKGEGNLTIAGSPSDVGFDGLGARDERPSPMGAGVGMSVRRVPTVQIGPLQVIGNLAPNLVERVVRTRLAAVRACYQSGLHHDPSLAGRVNVRFVIGQDGEVLSSMDGGSDLPDRTVVACVLGAIRTAVFPHPESGYVTVAFPLTLRAAEGLPLSAPPAYVPMAPSAVHRAEDDSWLRKGEDAVAKLRTDLEKNPSSRRKYEDLVRGLLARGRFEEAFVTAKKFVSMDPDLPVARELLAYAAVTNDDPELAVLSVDTQTETEPTSRKWHVRAARAFEALGDEQRACAHWRSLAELSPPSDESTYEALRCRARVLGDGDAALGDARRLAKPSKLMNELVVAIEGKRPPPFTRSGAGAGQLEADLACSSSERCPTVFVVSPIGNVFSPFTPTDSRSGAKSVAVAGLRDGTYMTLLIGGSPGTRGEVTVRAFGSTKKFPITRGGKQTVAATRVTLPDASARMMATRSDGFLIVR